MKKNKPDGSQHHLHRLSQNQEIAEFVPEELVNKIKSSVSTVGRQWGFSSLTQKVLKVKILQNIPNFVLWNDEKTSSSMCCSMWINCWRGFIRMIIPEDLPVSTTYPTVWISLRDVGLFPFVRNGRPDHSHHYENLTFNQNCVARSVKSWTICMGLMGFLVKTL